MTRAARPRSRSKWRAWLDADWASACLLHKIDCWLFRRVDSLNMDIVCAPKLGVELLITQAHEGLCFGLRPTRQSLFPSKWAVERERESFLYFNSCKTKTSPRLLPIYPPVPPHPPPPRFGVGDRSASRRRDPSGEPHPPRFASRLFSSAPLSNPV
jgi:hypothetical protein